MARNTSSSSDSASSSTTTSLMMVVPSSSAPEVIHVEENKEFYEQSQHEKRIEENKSLYKTVLKFVAGGISAGIVSGKLEFVLVFV